MRSQRTGLGLCLVLVFAMSNAPQQPASDPGGRLRTSAGMQKLGAATQALALDLWARLAAADGSFSYSPASIALAVAMTAAGARGETQRELLRFLHCESAELPGFAALGRLVEGVAGKARVSIGNRLFGAKGFDCEPSFLELLDREFKAPLETLDIAADPEKARTRVNDWIDRSTASKIRDLLPPGSVKPQTKLLLANAIWLLADWASPFEKEATRPLPFELPDGKSKDVPTMVRSDHLECTDVDGSVVVQLRYAGGGLAMLFVLPPKGAAAHAWLTPKTCALPADLPSQQVVLYLPKFRVEAERTLRLSQEMQALGVKHAFDRQSADFTGIADPEDPQDRLFVDEVFHKAFVRVDEKGTEAAAATVVTMAPTGAAPSPAPPREVRFDRPFAFVLRHLPTGAVLFAGRVVDPS